jgi:outer membrane protein OmpA-like peptidoglycan-associated protein/sugar lactone lactonase YvrE
MAPRNPNPAHETNVGARKNHRGRLISVASAVAAMALVPMTGAGANPTSVTQVTLSIFAGTGIDSTPTAGPATSSNLNQPYGVALDASGNVYIADSSNSLVEKVTPSGTLSIFSGNGQTGTPTPGPATSSAMNEPEGIAVDADGNVYIADSGNQLIEKVTSSGTLSILAGNGTGGSPIVGKATNSPLYYPSSLAVDSSKNVYIADELNHVVEKVTPAGELSIFAGTGTAGLPTAGNATSSKLNRPSGLAIDSSGNVYISNYASDMVVKVNSLGKLSIFAGTGTEGAPTAGPATSSKLGGPMGLAVDSAGNVTIADRSSNLVARVTPSGKLSIFAGTGSKGKPTPGPATSSNLYSPQAVAADESGNVYIADENNYVIEKVLLIDSTTPTIANLPQSATVGGTFTPNVATTGDGAKTVTSLTPSVCTVASGKVRLAGLGTCTLVAHVAIGATSTGVDGTAQTFAVGAGAPKVTPPADQVVYFTPGSSTVTQTGIKAIQHFAAAVKASNVKAVTVTGYATQFGSLAFNQLVSQQRADAVAHLLRSALGNLHVSGVTVRAVGGGIRTVAKTEAGNRMAILT